MGAPASCTRMTAVASPKHGAPDAAQPSPKKRRLSAPNTSHPIGRVDDVRIRSVNALLPPICLLEELPCEEHHADTIYAGREAIQAVLNGEDDRLVVIVGPCSVHDVKAAREYAHKLKKLITQHQNDLVVVMRVYFEKPRTT